ncbi:MAG: hypothetical protein ABI557_11850, partial [Aureliella sp.]
MWAYRPMMWLVAIAAFLALLAASISERNRLVLRSTFGIPGEYGTTGAFKLVPMSILKNGEKFQRSAQSGEVDTSVEGIDLTSMDLRDPVNPLEDFSSLEQALANYPSARWIRFDKDQVQYVSDKTRSKLSELATIIVHDNQITQTDVDTLAKFNSLQMLVLETLDFSAALNTLSVLPSLNALVLSNSTFNLVDSPMESLFRPEVLAQTQNLVHLRRLVLMPQWLPGEGYFAGSKTPDPACDPVLKENAAKLLPGHPSLTDLWLGVAKYERPGKDLATVQAALPDVIVRSAQYNENSISRAAIGSFVIVLLTSFWMFNMSGHFSTPQRRVIPHYEKPHIRFVFGFALLFTTVSTLAVRTPIAIAWLPAMAVSVLAVGFAVTMITIATIVDRRRPGLARILTVIMVAFFWVPLIRPVLRKSFPAMEPAADHFLSGHQPVLAIVIAIVCILAIYWMIHQFTDYDRLNAEDGLTPIITWEDFAKQIQVLSLQRRENQGALDTWNSRLKTLKSMPAGWLRNVRLDWMGEPKMPFAMWLFVAAVITFYINRFSVSEHQPGMTTFFVVGIALMIPLLTSLPRRDAMPLELLFPNSRAQFMRLRTLSIATKYSYLFAGISVYLTIVQSFQLHAVNLENIMRAVIMFLPITIAATGMVLWCSSIRNIFALGLLVM